MTKESGSKPLSEQSQSGGHGFGTAPVFLASISTILGAVMFLRFGYAVANLGLTGAILLILLGHMVTIPTALAIAEIATNRRVEGGGEYYIISRSFGTKIGGAIGISLYLSQAISVAFYMIAFAEAFEPILEWVGAGYGIALDPRVISIPATLLLAALILYKGASLGVRTLWVVSVVLAVTLGLFFAGNPTVEALEGGLQSATVDGPDPFIYVFAICFPAFTGMTAGVGLSGDLKNPRRSIPLGTLAGTVTGMVIYLLLVAKLASSATPEQLTDQLVMSRIALWPPIIPIGLAAASLSSAIGSILIAPRTLQALARDRVLPTGILNRVLSQGRGAAHEPVNATLASGVIALLCIAMGDVDTVAAIISMFFMVTYGALCSVSFLEHFAGNPSYRPSFRSRWYVSLVGAVMCFMMMFQMDPFYATVALVIMAGIYVGLNYAHRDERGFSAILQGVMFQLTRRLQIALQQSRAGSRVQDWRPSVLAVTRHSLDRLAHFDLLRWICHRHGFGQFIQYIEGKLSVDSEVYSRIVEEKMIRRTEASHAGVFVETIVAPKFEQAVAQAVQMPGVSGLPNNTTLLEFSANHPEEIEEVVAATRVVTPLGFNVCILRSTEMRFGYRSELHIWLTDRDFQNAALMILLAYIIIGHPEWAQAEIKVFACYPAETIDQELEKLNEMITQGRLPISKQNLTAIPYADKVSFNRALEKNSSEADLVILGFRYSQLEDDPSTCLMAHGGLNEVLFVSANEQISIF